MTVALAFLAGIAVGLLLRRFLAREGLRERMETMRREFVANVSHELKTPLTCIRGYAETLKHGALKDPEAAARFVDKIEANAGQLQNLVEDLLKLSEIESERMEINPETIILRTLVTEVADRFQETMEAKRIQCLNRISPEWQVKADPKAVRQILGNLIDNAVKYTPDKGVITLEVEPYGSFCRIVVRDTGIGIAERDLPRLFERFYRADKGNSRQMGGTGLGLAIVKHLVQIHGGEVGVRSEMDKGSEFWCTLPGQVS